MTLLSIILITSYIVYNINQFGMPKSLSSTYYNLKHGWIFSLIISLSAILIYPRMMEMTNSNYEFLVFLTLAGIIFVSVTPNFRECKLTDNVHTVSAILTLIVSQIWVALNDVLNLSWWLPVGVYIGTKIDEFDFDLGRLMEETSIKFVAEVVMLLTIYLTLINL